MKDYLFIETVGKKIVDNFILELDRVGILYRIFFRIKSNDSIDKKINAKEYRRNGKKVTDILGIRITLYFKDDVKILYKFLKSNKYFNHESLETIMPEVFRPERLNLTFNFSDDYRNEILSIIGNDRDVIDTTYEVQIRSVLSEGWHEVEHDLRYKSQQDWNGHEDLLRHLNGVFATLDTSDFTMLKIFDSLSYRHYKNKECSALIKSKFRLRFKSNYISPSVLEILESNPEIIKKIYRVERENLLEDLLFSRVSIPLTIDNFIYVINHIYLKNEFLFDVAGEFINDEIQTGLVRL